MAKWRVARIGSVAALVVAGSLLLSACAGTGYNYVKSSDFHTYFKVPDRWKLYDTKTLLDPKVSGLTQDEATAAAQDRWLSAFDASPSPRMSHLLRAKKYPWGIVNVQVLSPEAADSVSLKDLRNLYFEIDGSDTTEAAEVISYEAVNLDGGFHGSHLVANVVKNGHSMTVNQIAVLDQPTSKVYSIVMSCTTACYEKYQSKIENVMSSWTVRDS